MQYLINLFTPTEKIDYKTEVLSGLTVALALVPEAVAFALIAGLSPLTGLYAAFVMGLITSIFWWATGYDIWSDWSNSSCYSNISY